METLFLDGNSLTIDDVVRVASDPSIQVAINPTAIPAIEKSAAAVACFIATGQTAYGITTGFGAFKDRLISLTDVEKLQENILLSHAVGVGPGLEPAEVRAMMLIRANTLAKGHSGVRLSTLELLLALLNLNVLPVVPCKGSLGASGDLAPLAHMALPLIGKGMVDFQGKRLSTEEMFTLTGLRPIKLTAKEGLALTNGTSLMTALGTLAVREAENLYHTANVAAALTLEAQNGTQRAFDERIHLLRPQPWQLETAAEMRALLKCSQMTRPDTSTNVQDAYTLRCIPQVHGAVRNTIDYAQNVINVELNSVTDNPLLFIEDPANPAVLSGGNFHGEPLALALDFLSMALTVLGNISERRVAKLVDSANPSGTYPPVLAKNGGLNSGFMLLQYTAAALASDNKTLAHPASLDSIPSSGNVEDHVSMGANAALHCRGVLENVNTIVSIELMCAAQAMDFRLEAEPLLKMGVGTSQAYALVRKVVPFFEHDDFYQPKLLELIELSRKGVFAELAGL